MKGWNVKWVYLYSTCICHLHHCTNAHTYINKKGQLKMHNLTLSPFLPLENSLWNKNKSLCKSLIWNLKWAIVVLKRSSNLVLCHVACKSTHLIFASMWCELFLRSSGIFDHHRITKTFVFTKSQLNLSPRNLEEQKEVVQN